MNRAVKYSLIGCTLAIITVIVAAALGASSAKKKGIICSGVNIIIADSLNTRFVSKTDIKNYISKDYGTCTGKATAEIDLKGIEKILDGKSAVLKSEAYITGDKLNIEITQRQPLIRFQGLNGGFYSDRECYLFPLKNNYTSHVIVVDGHLPLKISAGYKGRGSDPKEMKWIRDITDIVLFMEDSRVWAENIVQIHVEKNGDLVMIPRKGNERFIFGKPEDIEEKFRKMSYYYSSIVPAKGEDRYKTVNLKYDRQIVCK